MGAGQFDPVHGPEATARTLLLLRHGRAEPGSGRDRDRALTRTGKAQARSTALQASCEGLCADAVILSPAVRTQGTWEVVREHLVPAGLVPQIEEGVYAGGSQAILDAVRGVSPRYRSVLVVGHEPTISGLSVTLAGQGSEPGALMQARMGAPTAGMFRLHGNLPSWEDLAPGVMRLQGIIRPLAG